MEPEELNKILLHAVINSWARQSYIQGWDFEGRSYKETCDMFERMEIAGSIYEGGETYKILSGWKLTMPILAERKIEEHPPHHSTPSWAALESAK